MIASMQGGEPNKASGGVKHQGRMELGQTLIIF